MGYNKDWWAANREDQNAKQRARYHKNKAAYLERQKIYYRKKKFGITPENLNVMLEDQDHKCALCLKEINETADIDHCHTSGKVRGLLCRQCNLGLGMFYDKIEIFERIIKYLKRNNDETL